MTDDLHPTPHAHQVRAVTRRRFLAALAGTVAVAPVLARKVAVRPPDEAAASLPTGDSAPTTTEPPTAPVAEAVTTTSTTVGPTTSAPTTTTTAVAVDTAPLPIPAAAPPPGGRADGLLVVVFLAGGNDGLNTVVPVGSGRYHDLRGALALSPEETLPLGDGYALNARMPGVKARWDQGEVAVVHGVGLPEPDLSHFVTAARLWTGWAGSTGTNVEGTGWLGRWLDGVDDERRLVMATIGATIPFVCNGARRRATAVATTAPEFGTATGADADGLYRGVRRLAEVVAAGGTAAERLVADAAVTALDDGASLTGIYRTPITGSSASAALVAAARMLDAGLGTRVVHVVLPEHDSHANQIDPHDRRHGTHQVRMADLDGALAAFHRELQPETAERTTVLVYSEFGRGLRPNGSNGTDHGTANCALLIGPGVRGGFHGQASSLDALDRNGNLVATADLRAVFAEVLDGWLGADGAGVVGRRFDRFGLFR